MKELMLVLKDSNPVSWRHSSPPDSVSYRPNSSVHLLIQLIISCFCLCCTPLAKSNAGKSIRAELFLVFNMYTLKYGPVMKCARYVSHYLTAAAAWAAENLQITWIQNTELLLHYDFGDHFKKKYMNLTYIVKTKIYWLHTFWMFMESLKTSQFF